MNKTTFLSVSCVLAAALASVADWVYDNGTLSDGVWTFGAALNDNITRAQHDAAAGVDTSGNRNAFFVRRI